MPLSKKPAHIKIGTFIFIGLAMIAGSSPLATAQSPPSARAWLGSSILGNAVYMMGGGICSDSSCGNFGAGETSVVETFNSATGISMTKAPLEIARFGLSASETNGKIYVFGGISGCCSAPEPSVEEYDPSTNTWSVKSTMLTPRWKLTSSAINGKIYTIGGGATGNQCVPTGTVEEYTPSSNTWASKNAMPTARW